MQGLEAQNVLKNVKVVNKLGIPVTVERVPVQYVNASTPELRTLGQYYSQSPVAWFRQPAVTLVLISCADTDEYRRNFRLQLRGMVDPEIRHPLDPEPVFVYVVKSGGDAEGPVTNAKPSSKVVDALRRELGIRNGRERVAKVELTPVENSTGENHSETPLQYKIYGIDEVVKCIQDGVAAALQTRTAAYADSTRRRLSALQASIPGASIREYYLVKDSMAMMLESAGLMEDALREYMELEVACQESLKGPQKEAGEITHTNAISSLSDTAAALLLDKQAERNHHQSDKHPSSWIWAPWPFLRMATDENFSNDGALTLRQAVFANQARVLLSLERYEDLLEAGITFFHQGLLQQQQSQQASRGIIGTTVWAFEGILSLTTTVAKATIPPVGTVSDLMDAENWWLGPLPVPALPSSTNTGVAMNAQSPKDTHSPRRRQRSPSLKVYALMGQLYLIARSLLEQLGKEVGNFQPPAQDATITQALEILKHKLKDIKGNESNDMDGVESIRTPPASGISSRWHDSPQWRRSLNASSPRARSLSPSRISMIDRPPSGLSSRLDNGKGSGFGLYDDLPRDELHAEASRAMHHVDLTTQNDLPSLPAAKVGGVTKSGSSSSLQSSSTPTAAVVSVEELTGEVGGEGLPQPSGIPVTRRATSSSSSLAASISSSKEQASSTLATTSEADGRDGTGGELLRVERAIMEMCYQRDHQRETDITKHIFVNRLSKAFASKAEFTSLWLALTTAATACFEAGGRRRTATMLRAESADGLLASSGSHDEVKEIWNECEALCDVALQEGWTEVARTVLVKLAVHLASVGELTRLVSVSTALLECLLENEESTGDSLGSEWKNNEEMAAAFRILTLVAHNPRQSPDASMPSRLLHHHNRKHVYYPPAFSGVDLCNVLRMVPLPGTFSLVYREAVYGGTQGGGGVRHCSVGDVVPVRLVVNNLLSVPVTLDNVRLELIGLQEMVQASFVVPGRLQGGGREASVDDEFMTPVSHQGRRNEVPRTERKAQEWRELEDLSCPLVQVTDEVTCDEEEEFLRVQPMVGPVIIPAHSKSILTFSAAPIAGGLYKPACVTAMLGNMSAWVPVTTHWAQYPSDSSFSLRGGIQSNIEAQPDAIILHVHPPAPRIQLSSTADKGLNSYLVAGHCQWLGIMVTMKASDVATIHSHDSGLKVAWPNRPSGSSGESQSADTLLGTGHIISLAASKEGGKPNNPVVSNVLISFGGNAEGEAITQRHEVSAIHDAPYCSAIPLAVNTSPENTENVKALVEEKMQRFDATVTSTVWMHVSVGAADADEEGSNGLGAPEVIDIVPITNQSKNDGGGGRLMNDYLEDESATRHLLNSLRDVDVPVTIEYESGCRRTHSQTLVIGVAPPFVVRMSAVKIGQSKNASADEIDFAIQLHLTALIAGATIVGANLVLEQPGMRLLDAVGMENILPLPLESHATACFSYVLRGDARRMLRPSGLAVSAINQTATKHVTFALKYTVPVQSTPFENGPLEQECTVSINYAFQVADSDTSPPSMSHINVRLLGPFSVIVGRPIALCWRLTRTSEHRLVAEDGRDHASLEGSKYPPDRIHYELHSHSKSWSLLGGKSGSVLLDSYQGAMATIQVMWSPLATGALPAPTLRLVGPPFDVMQGYDVSGGAATKYIYVTPDPCNADDELGYFTTRYDARGSRIHP